MEQDDMEREGLEREDMAQEDMAQTADAALILDSLDRIADAHGDIFPLAYRRFYENFPESRRLFGVDEDEMSQGCMFNSILIAILDYSEGRFYRESVEGWISDHGAWGVTHEMFRTMFDAVYETIRSCAGASWNDAVAAAWQRNIYGLAEQFDQVYRSRASKASSAPKACPWADQVRQRQDDSAILRK